MLKFEKVSKEAYELEICNNFKEDTFLIDYKKGCYKDIKLPKRATKCSAGYDFYIPYGLSVKANTWYTVPLGIKYITDKEDIVLMLFPRSGLGFKNNFQLINTVGIIDADYQFAKNEGQIIVKFKTNKDIIFEAGQAILQGIFTTYLTVDEDNSQNERIGGFGSTSK